MEAFEVSTDTNDEHFNGFNVAIDNLPFEIHPPGYNFMGPGTKLAERLARGDIGINPLDEACREHDIAYNEENGDRQTADRVLAERAFSRVLASDAQMDEKAYAALTACCMVTKINFEKFFSRITKALSRGNKIKQRKERKKKKMKHTSHE